MQNKFMKKLIYTTILFFTISSANAQIKEFGIRLGGSFSDIGGTAFNDRRTWGNFSRTSYGTTIEGSEGLLISLMPTFFARYEISEKFFFQPEVGVSFNGFNQKNVSDSKDLSSNTDIKIRLTYLQIPLLLGYKFNDGDYKPFIIAGFTPAFLLSANAKSETNTTDKSTSKQTNTVVQNSGDINKKLDLGFTIGGGVMSFRSMPALGADIRLNLGQVNLVDDPNALYFTDYSAYNYTLSIAVYYRFSQ